MYRFQAQLDIIGVNPFVFVPEDILEEIFLAAGKNKGPIPVHGTVNTKPYTQTLVRYAGDWRLYINTTMLKNSPKHVGEFLELSIAYDPRDRSLPLHPKLAAALMKHPEATKAFESLAPHRRHEINRYIHQLKTESKVDENVQRAIRHLEGKERFAGR